MQHPKYTAAKWQKRRDQDRWTPCSMSQANKYGRASAKENIVWNLSSCLVLNCSSIFKGIFFYQKLDHVSKFRICLLLSVRALLTHWLYCCDVTDIPRSRVKYRTLALSAALGHCYFEIEGLSGSRDAKQNAVFLDAQRFPEHTHKNVFCSTLLSPNIYWCILVN